MDVTKIGVRTRAEAQDRSGQMKRRKVEAEELALCSSSLTHEHFCEFPQTSNSQGDAIAAENEMQYSNFTSDGGASCCSSDDLSTEAATDHKLINSTDLEESVAIEALSSNKYNTSESGETTPLNQQAGEAQALEPESTSVTSICCHQKTNERFMPWEEELKEFFAVAEKNLRKRFTDKYNYDISKDEPLSGRYEWVPLKP